MNYKKLGFYFMTFILMNFSILANAYAAVIQNKSIQKGEVYFRKQAEKSQISFIEGLKKPQSDIEYLLLRQEKMVNFQNIPEKNLQYFDFNALTQSVVRYIGNLKRNYSLSFKPVQRKQIQYQFYSLSQAIKKANQLHLNIQSDQFDKLHDLLVSQSTSLFYLSFKERNNHDLFWVTYFLSEVGYPMDLTAKFLVQLEPRRHLTLNQRLGSQLARISLTKGVELNSVTVTQLDQLFDWSVQDVTNEIAIQKMQKLYLKQLQTHGAQDKVKAVKKQLASNLLWQETKNVATNPLGFFKYLQFLIGYIFIALPLEYILIIVSALIFLVQSPNVLTFEEKKRKKLHQKVWLMFTKSYMGNNVPFFSKVAASLVLFGVGLYFNSAKNFVESLMANF